MTGDPRRFYYDGVNEVAERSGNDIPLRYYAHGISYVDERLMIYWAANDDGGDTVVVHRPRICRWIGCTISLCRLDWTKHVAEAKLTMIYMDCQSANAAAAPNGRRHWNT